MRSVKMFCSAIAAMVLLSVQGLMAQNTVKITGQVTDSEGQPLEGVAVMDSDKKTGTLTDAQGKYSISVKEKSVLVFDYMGYAPAEARIGGKTVVNIALEEDRTFLEEAVVVGYGTVRRSDLTGSVSSVSAKSLENFKTANVLDALGGQVAGVNITTTDGAPGSTFSIIVRGVSTINGESSPLYYVDSVVNKDIQRVDNVKRSSERAKLLLRSYARNISQSASYSTIRKDMLANDSSSLDEDTVADYIKALKKLFVIEDLEAWNPNIRSRAAIRTGDTRHFVDPSIGTAALGIGPKDLVNDIKSFGFFFEDMVVRDLRVYAEVLDGKLYHYRDSNGLECDTVLHRRNGSYALMEVKLGGQDLIEEGAKNMIKLANSIDTEKMPSPSFMAVVIGVGKYAYQREDGVYVIPIGCLKD